MEYELPPSPPSPDLDGDGVVDSADLGLLMAAWNEVGGNPADLNQDGIVNAVDLGILIAAWGPVV